MKKQTLCYILIFFFCALNLMSCAPAGHTAASYGFFSGILHGFLFVFALIGKLFGVHCGIYAEHNTGFFYWLGFIIGLGGLGGGGREAARRR